MSHLSPVPSDPDGLRQWLIERREAEVDLGFEWRNPEVELPPAPDRPSALTVEVTLRETDPAVRRRLRVPGNLTLDRVHDVVQTAMGWADSHPHRFFSSASSRAPYFVTPEDIDDGEDGTRERDVRLDQVLRAVGDAVLYEYDVSDSWAHELRLVKVGKLKQSEQFRCTEGAGACPPEDVGGVDGYAEVADWVRRGRRSDNVPAWFESYEHADGWLPHGWHPDELDLDEVNNRLAALTIRGEVLDSLRPDAQVAVRRLSPRCQAMVSSWAEKAAEQPALSAADLDELTAPYHVILDTLDDGVELTPAGYLPATAVRKLWPALHIDPMLVGRSNREDHIRPLLMFRVAAERAGLFRRRLRRLYPTKDGRRLAGDPRKLWRFVSTRLPDSPTDVDAEIGWFTLLALAGGVGRGEVFRDVHALCVDAGWKEEDGRTIERAGVSELMWVTLAALVGARWNSREPWPDWVPAAAASVVFPRGARA